MLAALKSLPENSNACHLSVGIYRLTFFIQFETLLALGVMREFRLEPERWLLCSSPLVVVCFL